jgi:hypothetical protein
MPFRDVMRQIFRRSVSGTILLIAKQVQKIEARREGDCDYHVRNIFLAGGFSQSPYLLSEVNRWAKARNIKVQRALEEDM